ncbi:toll/interleukin-1 receptor domain-containing protein [Bradyrhizobium sp. 139]|uniref:toll/interleukin-1 receptor domain-containing protein n=1 Tax=Bradyrhizobium sp. 139 TaxID=2782616 RepID=UPI001FF93EAB|nr:toll/interleukin-1 receptor domain-containing protein [Bradyrhizobium sp. 139]
MIKKTEASETRTIPTGPRTFITYAQENEQFKTAILSLADRLRSEGVDVRIDQYESHPPQGWPRWMEDQFLHAEKIIVVPSQKYLNRYSQVDGIGSGARFEAVILRTLLLKNGVSFEKIAVASLSRADQDCIPDLLHGCSRYGLADDRGYEDLYRWLTQQPAITAPELGRIRTLSPSPRPKARDPSFAWLCRELLPIMNDNYRVFRDFGPNSGADSQGPVRFNLNAWYELRKSKIIPNNQIIRQMITEYRALIPKEHTSIFERLISHIDAFEAHVNNDQVDYREHQFPTEITAVITRAANE